MKGRRRIAYTLFLTLLLIATIPVTILGWMLLRQSRENLARDQRMFQLQVGRTVALEISGFMEHAVNRLNEIERLIGTPGSAPLATLLRSDQALRALQGLVERESSQGVLAAAIYDDAGAGLRAGSSFREPGLESMMKSGYDRAIHSGEPSFSTPYHLEQSGHAVMVISRPLEGFGPASGAVQEVVDLETLRSILRDHSLSGNHVALLDQGHAVVVQSKDAADPAEAGALQSIVADLKGQDVPAAYNRLFREPRMGENVVATVVPVRNLGWHIVLHAREGEIFGPLRSLLEQAILWIALVILMAGLASLALARWISYPIKQLAATSGSIARGRFSERVNVSARNEIGEFAENFNSMAATIEGYVTELQHSVESNRQLFFEAIQTLAAVVDEKDPYTRGHSERVTHYSLILGRLLELDENELEKLRIAALLHDVGKIGIDDAILKKPDVLTQSEFEVMKQHPAKGANIVGKIGQLRDVGTAIRYHHEQVDGNGYPDRLAGEAIPLASRIISVADTFDAMTTVRPYQKPMATDFVLGRIRSMTGVKFDERVVAALEQAVADGKIKRFRGSAAELEAHAAGS